MPRLHESSRASALVAGWLFLVLALAPMVSAQTMTVSNGLKLWLKADSGVTTNAFCRVCRWHDQSGLANHADQSVSTNCPTFVANAVNGHPAVRFDGVNDCLATPSVDWTGGDYSYLAVFRKDGVAKGHHVIFTRARSFTNAGSFFQLISTNGGYPAVADAVNSRADAASRTLFTTNIFRLLSVVRRDKTAAGTRLYVDGDLQDVSYAAVVTNSVGAVGYEFYLGGWNGRYAKASLAELLVYNRALSEAERRLAEDYLAQKYRLPADSDGDGIPDDAEVENGLDPNDPGDAALDADGDGLNNRDEYLHGTNPRLRDTDGDAMPDGFEVMHGLDPLVNDASLDADGDGMSNLREYRQGRHPGVGVVMDDAAVGLRVFTVLE